MSEGFKKYITAISAALFLFVAASGLAMFFGVGKHVVEEMHEWLAVTFVVAVGLHIFKNWSGMMNYVRRRTIVAPLALALVAAAAFVVPAALSERRNPVPNLLHAIENAKLADVGRVLDVPAASLQAALEAQGFVVESEEQRLSEIASASQKPPMAAVMTVLNTER